MTEEPKIVWDQKSFPNFTDKHKSLCAKYCTKQVWEANKDKSTKTTGFTLAKAINSGVINADSGIGVYAGDMESYAVFKDLFDPIIEEYHSGYKPGDKHKSDMDWNHLKTDVEDKTKLVRSTRIRVARNIKGFGLTAGMSQENRKKVEQLMISAFNSLTGELKGTYYPLGSMSSTDRDALIKAHFLFKKGDRFLEEAGCNREWPEARGIFHNDAKTFLVWMNEEDTLRIISMENTCDVKGVFTRLAKGITAIEESLQKAGHSFQHDDHLGYYSACPTNLGTGMRASVHIRLEKVSQKEDFKKWCSENGLQVRGIHGEHTKLKAGEKPEPVFDISNKYRLGHSEVDLVEMMSKGVNELIKQELS